MAYTNIDDPSAYFQTAFGQVIDCYQSITNDGNSDLQPDWIWIKRRELLQTIMLLIQQRSTGRLLAQIRKQKQSKR